MVPGILPALCYPAVESKPYQVSVALHAHATHDVSCASEEPYPFLSTTAHLILFPSDPSSQRERSQRGVTGRRQARRATYQVPWYKTRAIKQSKPPHPERTLVGSVDPLTMFIRMTFVCDECPGGTLTTAAHTIAQPTSAYPRIGTAAQRKPKFRDKKSSLMIGIRQNEEDRGPEGANGWVTIGY